MLNKKFLLAAIFTVSVFLTSCAKGGTEVTETTAETTTAAASAKTTTAEQTTNEIETTEETTSSSDIEKESIRTKFVKTNNIDSDVYPLDSEEININVDMSMDIYGNIKYDSFDLENLKYYSNLKRLSISAYNESAVYRPIKLINCDSTANLNNLEEISLYQVEFDDDWLTGINSLKKLDFDWCKLNWEFLHDLPQVETLVFDRCYISEFDFINDMKSLSELSLTHIVFDGIEKFEIAEENNSLKRLSLSENAFTDISGIAKLRGLEYLYVSEANLKNPAKLDKELQESLPECEIEIYFPAITDPKAAVEKYMEALFNNENVTRVELRETKINQTSAIADKYYESPLAEKFLIKEDSKLVTVNVDYYIEYAENSGLESGEKNEYFIVSLDQGGFYVIDTFPYDPKDHYGEIKEVLTDEEFYGEHYLVELDGGLGTVECNNAAFFDGFEAGQRIYIEANGDIYGDPPRLDAAFMCDESEMPDD